MKRFFLLGILTAGILLGCLKSVTQAALEYEMAKPFVTPETISIEYQNLDALNAPELLAQLQEDWKALIPNTLADEMVQKWLKEGETVAAGLQKRIDAARKLSGGTLFSVTGSDGFLIVVPIQNPDAKAEKLLLNVLEDLPFAELEYEGLTPFLELAKQAATVQKVKNAIVLFVPLPLNGENANSDAKPDPAALLKTHLAAAADHPAFERAFLAVEPGKYQTQFIFPPLKALQSAFDGEESVSIQEFLEGSPISADELQTLVLERTSALVHTLDQYGDLGRYSLTFKSKKDAAKVMAFYDFVASKAFKLASLHEAETPIGEDLVRVFFKLLRPTQNGKSLTIDGSMTTRQFVEKYLAPFEEYQAYSQAQREKYAAMDLKAETARQVALLAPWLTDETALAVRLDLERIQPLPALEAVMRAAKVWFPTFLETQQFQQGLQQVQGTLALVEEIRQFLLSKGAKEGFLLVDPSSAIQPIRIVIPNAFSQSKEADSAKEFGTAVTLTEFAADAKPQLLELFKQVNESGLFTLGTWKGALVLLPNQGAAQNGDASEMWEVFAKAHKPSEKTTDFASALAEGNVTCPLTVTFRMTQLVERLVGPMIDTRNFSLTIPPAKVVTRGLNAVTLSLDPAQGIADLKIISKTEKSANKITKLLDLWQNELTDQVTRELPADAPPVAQALIMDYVHFLGALVRPVQDGKRFRWDYSQNEQIKTLAKIMSQPSGQVAVGGIAVGLFLPAVQQARDAARKMQMTNNFKWCALAMQNFESVNRTFPTACTVDAKGKPLHSWRVQLLPFLEQNELYSQIRLDEPWDSEWNQQFHDQCPKVFQMPDAANSSDASIGVIVGKDCIFEPVTEKGQKGTAIDEITDGASNTILLVSCPPVCWMDPSGDLTLEDALNPETIPSTAGPDFHAARNARTLGFHAARADASVLTYSKLINPKFWRILILKNDGQMPEPDWL